MLLKVNGGTARDKMKAQTLYALNNLMAGVAGDTQTLLEVVAGGPTHWRQNCLRVCAGLAVDENIADSLFRFFAERVVAQFGRELSAARLLDALEVASPPSQREIDDAWEVESFSSEDGRRYFYGVDGHPEQVIKQLREH
ncbi:MAG: hypothetical protein WC876_11715 [Candidatus Thermoplasmatota archaeon]|jgi:hypothetical protein